MSKQVVNGSFSLEIPDAFQPMSREELRMFYREEDMNQWGVWDREHHVLITVLWKQYPLLLSWLADLKAMAKRNQQLVSRGYEGHDYCLSEYLSIQAGKVQTEGYRFTFRQGEISQAAETFLFKTGKLVYSISCIGREENREADQVLFHKVLDSLRIL